MDHPGRPQHPGGHGSPREGVAGIERLDRHPGGSGPAGDLTHLVVGVGHRAGEDLPDDPAAEHPRRAVDVVGVEVREHEGVHLATRSRRRQASIGAGSGPASMTTAWPGVVASARPSPWPTSQATSRQPGGGHPTLPVGQAAASEHRRERRHQPRAAPQQGHQPGPQNSSTRLSPASRNAPGGPSGQGSEPIGTSAHRIVPPRRSRSSAASPPRPRRRDGSGDDREQCHRDAQHGGRRDQGRGEQVRQHPDHADRTLQQHHHRAAHRLCRHRDRDRGAQPVQAVGQVAGEPPAPRAGEEQQPQRRQGREGEAERSREPRVDHQQRHHGTGQRRDAGPPTRGAQPHQPDHPHDGGPEHAGLGPGEDHEGGQQDTRHHRSPTPADAQDAAQPDARREDHRHVAARHRRQVGHARRQHRLGQRRRRPAGVADHQRGQEPPGVGRERGDRVREGRHGRARPLPPPTRRRAAGWVAPGVEDGDDVVTAVGDVEPPAGAHGLVPAHGLPGGVAEDEHRGACPALLPATGHRAHVQPDQHHLGRRRPGRGDDPRVGDDHRLERDGGPLLRQARDEPGLAHQPSARRARAGTAPCPTG